jgi:hypothetical protein
MTFASTPTSLPAVQTPSARPATPLRPLKAKGLSVFCLAPRLEHIAPLEQQQQFALALGRVRQGTQTTLKRFPPRSFKRLSPEQADQLFFDLLMPGQQDDILHLYLDWHATLGHYAMHQCLHLWLHVLQTQRYRPTLIFPIEGPVFLENPLMIRERKAWALLTEHLNDTPQHVVVVHTEADFKAWCKAGLAETAVRLMPRPTSFKPQEAPVISPSLLHLVRQRLNHDTTPTASGKGSAPFTLGFFPTDDDLGMIEAVLHTLSLLPEAVKLLVMGGGEAHAPTHQWEGTLLQGIQQRNLQHRVIITGTCSETERSTYLNCCNAVVLAHHHGDTPFQMLLFQSLAEGRPVLVSGQSETVSSTTQLFQQAWEASPVYTIVPTQEFSGTLQHLMQIPPQDEHHFMRLHIPLVQAMEADAIALRYLTLYDTLLEITPR